MKKITWQFLSDEVIKCCDKIAKKYHEGIELFTEDNYHDNLHTLLNGCFTSFLEKVGIELDIKIKENVITHSLNDELKEFCKEFAEKYHKGWEFFVKDDWSGNLPAILSNFLTDFLRRKLCIEIDITFPPE